MHTLTPNHIKYAQMVGLLICVTTLIAVSFSIILRIEPSLLQNDLRGIFHLSPDKLGELVIRYQYSLIATLLLAGFIVDYFGARTTLVIAIIVAMIGNYLFGKAVNISAMIHGRILIGYAHPFILISALKLGTEWLSNKRFPFFVGLLFATLLMTPIIAKLPLSKLAQQFDMPNFVNLINLIGVLVASILLFTRKAESKLETEDNLDLRVILGVVLSKPIWMIGVISCLGWIANTFLLDYGTLFLIKNLHLDHKIAKETINIGFMCFALGAVMTGLVAETLHKKRLLIVIGYTIAAIAFSIVLYIPHLGTKLICSLIFVTAFFTGTAIICYAKAYEYSTPSTAGCVFALIAFITTLGNTLFTLLVGNIIEALPTTSTSQSLTWQILLALIPSALAIGAILAIHSRKNSPARLPRP